MRTRSPWSVDVVIPTHTVRRPVERSIASVLDDAPQDVRVILVCHGVDPTAVLDRVAQRHRDRVDVVRHDDGIRSPAGPFNAGYRAATATFVSPMSSDDYARPRAVGAWLAVARESGADVVIARVESDTGALQPNPPTRWGRRSTDLDADRDRLFYRTVPQGLVRRTLPVELGIGYTEGLTTGEDIAFTTRLWSSGAKIAYARSAPAYVLADDVDDRVSLALRPLRDELRGVRMLCAAPWVVELPAPVRLALAVKLLRIHVLGALAFRVDSGLDDDDIAVTAAAVRELVRLAPDLREVLSAAEARTVAAVAAVGAGASAQAILNRAHDRRRHGHPDTLRTRNLRMLLHRQAPARLMAASILMAVSSRRRPRVTVSRASAHGRPQVLANRYGAEDRARGRRDGGQG